MRLGAHWTKAVANQYSQNTLRKLPYLILIILLVCIGLAVVGDSNASFGALSFDFFLLADFFTVKLARRNIHFMISGLIGTLGAAMVYGILTLALGLLFKW